MNTVYGGLEIDATNVIFPSGSIDPWHALGVTDDTETMSQESEIPLFIVGTSHCADLPTPAPYDPPELTEARSSISAAVNSWLSSDDIAADSGDDDDDDFFSTNAVIVGLIGVAVGVGLTLALGALYKAHKSKSDFSENNLDEKLI